MNFLQIFLIAISVSMDAFVVAISSGIALKKTSIKNCLKIGIFFGIFQFIMPFLGNFLSKIYEKEMIMLNHFIASTILVIIGVKMILDACKNEKMEHIDIMDTKKLIVLSIATSIDALAVGITFSVTKTSIILSCAVIGTVAFFFSSLGVYLGEKIGITFSKNAEKIGGMVLIFIGIEILLQYLLK